MITKAYAPATVGNFIAGFDVLGCALERLDGTEFGDEVTVRSARHNDFTVTGPYASRVPADPKENLATLSAGLYFKELEGISIRRGAVAISLEKRLPVCSGLGSSSSTIVATLAALNAHHGFPLPESRILSLCARAEGLAAGTAHYDNVAPALLGGLVLTGARGDAFRLPAPKSWALAVCFPGGALATAVARKVLPESYPLKALVEHSGRLAAFVAALYRGEAEVAADCLKDQIAEAYRAPLVPTFPALARAARSGGALAFSLSGSGPSCMAVCPSEDAALVVADKFKEACTASEGAFSLACRISAQGARLCALPEPERDPEVCHEAR